jgi:hypothetical protein
VYKRQEYCIEFAHVLTDVVATNYSMDLSRDPREQCPLCKDGIPIDTRVGHGKKFLADIHDTYPDLHEKLSRS